MMQEKNLFLDLNPIFTGEKKKLELSFEFIPQCPDDSIRFEKPLHAAVSVYEKAASGGQGLENLVEATLHLTGFYGTACARCLAELNIPVDMTERYAVVIKLENEGEDGYLLAPGGRLDVTDAADALFYMLLPSRHLCSSDCKGLCQVCGKNRNTEICNCHEKNIDPRLAVLKKLLDKQEN